MHRADERKKSDMAVQEPRLGPKAKELARDATHQPWFQDFVAGCAGGEEPCTWYHARRRDCCASADYLPTCFEFVI